MATGQLGGQACLPRVPRACVGETELYDLEINTQAVLLVS